MFSIRSFARAAPKNISRFSTSALRTRSARPTSLLQSAFRPARTQYASAFSTSSMRRSGAEGDAELIHKLESEIAVENEMADDEGVPTSVKDYLENGPFKITDIPGQEDVVLTRQFGDEKISISFSIADLNALDPDSEEMDRALGDENENDGEGKEQQDIEGEEGAESDEEPQGFPARLSIVVEKPGKGALAVDGIVQDGLVVIDNVYYYTDASHAHAKTAEKIHERQDLYVGPPFGNLDEDLQVLMEKYLDDRGINAALTIFVPAYIDVKEQKEYIRWLENVKGFVEA